MNREKLERVRETVRVAALQESGTRRTARLGPFDALLGVLDGLLEEDAAWDGWFMTGAEFGAHVAAIQAARLVDNWSA